MAWSKLSADEQGIILGQLRNALEPRLVMYFSSTSKELRAMDAGATDAVLALLGAVTAGLLRRELWHAVT